MSFPLVFPRKAEATLSCRSHFPLLPLSPREQKPTVFSFFAVADLRASASSLPTAARRLAEDARYVYSSPSLPPSLILSFPSVFELRWVLIFALPKLLALLLRRRLTDFGCCWGGLWCKFIPCCDYTAIKLFFAKKSVEIYCCEFSWVKISCFLECLCGRCLILCAKSSRYPLKLQTESTFYVDYVSVCKIFPLSCI